MDSNGIGAHQYYFSKLWKYWSDKCTECEITESQMEDKIDLYESMSAKQLKNAWRKIYGSLI